MSETIGVLGSQASYHEVAAQSMGYQDLAYRETFTAMFDALHNRNVGGLVVAIANNRVGFIADVYDQIAQADSPYTITGETYLRIDHALLGVEGATIAGVTHVHSHAAAIGQSSHYLEQVLPHAHISTDHDTATSAKMVAEMGDRSHAAVASIDAGKLYGLVPLAQAIQNDKDNITRFLEVRLAEDAQPIEDADKTTIILKTPQRAGALLDALQPFKDADINLTYLQSHIIPNSPFDIGFFAEFEAGAQEARTQQVLQALDETGHETHVLGTYRRAEVPMVS